jgi:hypothetical protein
MDWQHLPAQIVSRRRKRKDECTIAVDCKVENEIPKSSLMSMTRNAQPETSRVRHMGWLIVLLGALVLAFCAYLNRERLERAVVAISVYRAHIFSPPQPLTGESRWARSREHAQFY